MDSLVNPFTVQTPEDIPAKEVLALFVDVFTDFPKILGDGHVFLNGPRGSGKSMILRYLQPDCQLLHKPASQLKELEFFAAYAPLKNCDLKLTELRRLEGQHASVILNEHFMVMYIAVKTFASLAELMCSDTDPAHLAAAQAYGADVFWGLLAKCGYDKPVKAFSECHSVGECCRVIADTCESLFHEVISYLRHLDFRKEVLPFYGPLCGYLDMLCPLLKTLGRLPFMPGPGKPIYLLIDDADNLNVTQTRILNSWVSSRTSRFVSIKIATQMHYRTFRTVTGQTIDTPHDYTEVNISTVYTSSKRRYKERVREIVRNRLRYCGIVDTDPEDFFPPDAVQEQKVQAIAERHRRAWSESGRGYRPDDDALRYARPDYMKELAGTTSSTYSYSGFEQLVHVSSGIIRYFLEAAAEMFSEMQAEYRGAPIASIRPEIQNRVVRKQADEFLFDDLEKLRDDESADSPDEAIVTRLNSLVRALGGVFWQILLSNRSERRVFSVALSDDPSGELREVLRLGMRYGYFHESSIGNKEGTGRTRLYILSRRLAPHFNLDPTSFAGYFFLKSSQLVEAMRNPETFIRGMEKRIYNPSGSAESLEERQLKLFE
jgi:hypothetical protein